MSRNAAGYVRRAAVGVLASTTVLLAGCGSPPDRILSVEFGSDFQGMSVDQSLSRGKYVLRMTKCHGADTVEFRVKSGNSVLHSGSLRCAAGAEYRFELTEAAAEAEAHLELEASGAEGSAELHRA